MKKSSIICPSPIKYLRSSGPLLKGASCSALYSRVLFSNVLTVVQVAVACLTEFHLLSNISGLAWPHLVLFTWSVCNHWLLCSNLSLLCCVYTNKHYVKIEIFNLNLSWIILHKPIATGYLWVLKKKKEASWCSLMQICLSYSSCTINTVCPQNIWIILGIVIML